MQTAAYLLEGTTLPGEWRVGERVELGEDHSGSAYSVGYYVEQRSKQGFLKVFDYSAALDADDPATELQELTALYNAELALLEACRGHNFDRVVRMLDAGSYRVPHAPPPSVVNYLIFERAKGDARAQFEDHDFADQLPMLRLAHNAAVGVAQLHSINASHQDLKPSNLLVLGSANALIAKLGDLGFAHLPGRPAPQDELIISGDPAYASPEQLYGCPIRLSNESRRKASDIFMLENLISFLMVGVPYNGILSMKLDPSLHWKWWNGDFDSLLPGLEDAHGQVIAAIQGASHSYFSEELGRILTELCHPDPYVRGDRIARRLGGNPYRLERHITRLDLLHRKASIALR